MFHSETNQEISYAVAEGVFCIVNLNFQWVENYADALARITQLAREKNCSKLAAFYTRKSSGKFLKKKGWKDKGQGIVEYVL